MNVNLSYKTQNRLVGVATLTFLVAIVLFTGQVVAFSDEFSQVRLKVGGRHVEIRPDSLISRAGRKLGLPLYEMEDTFFVTISYSCSSATDGELQVIKDRSLASASAVYPSGGRCYMTFRSPSTMRGVMTIRFKTSEGWDETNVVVKRSMSFLCPIWDRMASV